MSKKILVLLPAYNEENNIATAIESGLGQTRKPDKIVVIANGCNDNTVEIARGFPVTVIDLRKLKYGKSEALNIGWKRHQAGFDIIVCADADMVFSRNSIRDWEKALENKQNNSKQEVVACTGSIRIIGSGIANTFQYFSFRHFVDLSKRYGEAVTLYGSACAFKNRVLQEVSKQLYKGNGPWDNSSDVEDYKLQFILRKMGYNATQVPSAYVETIAMPTIKLIFTQNVRWISGAWKTHFELGFGRFNCMGILTWWLPDLIRAILKFAWLVFTVLLLIFNLSLWYVPLVVLLVLHCFWLRPYILTKPRNWKDQVIKFSFFPLEFYSWLSSAINVTSFIVAIREYRNKQSKNRWRNKG